jgi:hypothetical protein
LSPRPCASAPFFGILLVLIALVAFGPALVAVGSQEVAEAFGCQVDLNRVIPCQIGGKDYGQTFYDLGFLIWYSYLSLPAGLVLFGVWVVVAIIAFIVIKRRQHRPPSEPPSPGKSFLRGALIVIALALSPIAVTYSAGFIASFSDAILTKRQCIPAPCSASMSARCSTQWGSRSGSLPSRLRRAWSRFSCLRSSGSRAP